MKKCIFFLTVYAFLSSCAVPKMQIVSLENEKMSKNDTMWDYKDSLVDIWYNFYTPKGSDWFIIYNKNSKPVFFDLKNSFVSVNNFKKDFWSDVSQFNGNLTFKQYKSVSLQTQNPISGNISTPDRIIMIPPNSTDGVKTTVNIVKGMYGMDNYKCTTDTVSANWYPSKKTTVIKTASFDNSHSPTKVRIFLTLSKTEDFKDPVYLDFYFWVSGIMEMDARQATNSADYLNYTSGLYTLSDNGEKKNLHPYKKAWRFYISQ